MDPAGTILAMGAIISYILAMQYGGQTKPWNSSTVIGLLVGFVLITIAFGVWEYFQGERATLVPRLMRDRNIWVNSVFTLFFSGSYFIIVYYLPIYFQAIDNVSPSVSGIRNLPLIISVSLAMVFSGGSISKTGIATPFLVLGAAIATIAAGLLYTLDIGTGAGKWIGYQILGGVGWGLAYSVPIIVAQNTSQISDIAPVTSIILCMLRLAKSTQCSDIRLTIDPSFPNSWWRLRRVGRASRLRESDHLQSSQDRAECQSNRRGRHWRHSATGWLPRRPNARDLTRLHG